MLQVLSDSQLLLCPLLHEFSKSKILIHLKISITESLELKSMIYFHSLDNIDQSIEKKRVFLDPFRIPVGSQN